MFDFNFFFIFNFFDNQLLSACVLYGEKLNQIEVYLQQTKVCAQDFEAFHLKLVKIVNTLFC